MLENNMHPNLAILKVGPKKCIVRDDFTTYGLNSFILLLNSLIVFHKTMCWASTILL